MIALGTALSLAGIAGIMWLTFPVMTERWRGLMTVPIFAAIWLGGMALGAAAMGLAP